MATVQSLQHSGMSTASSCPSGSSDGFIENGGFPAQFPAGLRVLVVDDDPICLKILEKMLRRCLYEVTICCRATDALSTLRERKRSFDLVISDVYMPDMDGFKLLEHIGLEMDLPVIMMSVDGETSVVMKGIKHGACDYLLKPVRMEELRNIWQHVVRKKRNGGRDLEHSGSIDDTEQHKKGSDDDYASSVNEGTDGNWKTSKRRKSVMEEDDDFGQENDDPSSLKKPRVVWSVELHQQFVGAVNQLGIDKAVPKRILEIMNVPGLTRENVASHLQKYRLYLRRLSGVAQQQSGMNSSFGGNTETNFVSTGSLGKLDLQTLASSGQITPHALVAWQAGLLGRVNANNGLGIPGEALCLQASLQSINSNSSNRAMLGQPLVNSQGNSLEGLPSGFQFRPLGQPQPHAPFGNMGLSLNDKSSMLQQKQLATAAMGLGDLGQICAMDNSTSINRHNNALMMQLIQQQRQQQQLNQCMQTPAPQPCQTGVQLQGRQFLSLPSASLLGLPVLSEDFGGRANPLPATGNDNSITSASSGRVNHMLPSEDGLSVCASNAYMGIDRMPAVDYKNHGLRKMPGNSLCLQGIVGASAPSSVAIEDEVSMQGTKDLGGAPEIVNSQTFGGSGLNFSTSSTRGLSLSQKNMQGWQVQNFALDQDLSHIVTPVQNSRYSRASSGTHAFNVPGIQDHGQVQCPRFIGEGSGPPGRSTSDAGCLRTVSSTQYQGDKSTADNGLILKGSVSDLMDSSKMNGGLVAEQSLTSGDPVNLLYKQVELCDLQQQGGAGLAGGEFSMDGYQLNNVNA